MTEIVAVLDACVLHSAPLRDLFVQLAIDGLYLAKWTDTIHSEWIQSVLTRRPDINRESLEYVRDLMNTHVRDSLVEGYQPLIETLTLPDPKDRHILATAIHIQGRIITFNLSDFPCSILDTYGIQRIHPDDFVVDLINTDFALVCFSIRKVRQRLKNPPKTPQEYLEILHKNNLKNTALSLKGHIHRL